MAELRVAMVGTPDAANFGDVLFPVLAAHELGRRLDGVELTFYGYRDIAATHWPYPVRSLGALTDEIGGYDLLLIGGGYIVRDDAAVAPGYGPSDPRVHQPLGLWLVPALLAHAAGVPVAWNAVGVSERLGGWLTPLVRAAIDGSAYVAVRSESSARALAALAPDATIHIVPDTAFGASAVVDDAARAQARALLARAGIGDRGYVIVQSTSGLEDVREAVEDALAAARAEDLAILELPIGPVLGDAEGAFAIPGQTATLDAWPAPSVLAALIAGARSIVHESLHAGVVAFAAGVPCLRKPMAAGLKHDQLNGLPGIHLLGVNGAAGAVTGAGEAAPGDTVREMMRGSLDAHWDAIAALAVPRDAAPPNGALLELIARAPGLFEASAARIAALESDVDAAAEYEAAYRAFAQRTAELENELASVDRWRSALGQEVAELSAALDACRTVSDARAGYLLASEEQLRQIRAGGWWRLRERLAPLRRLRRRVRRGG